MLTPGGYRHRRPTVACADMSTRQKSPPGVVGAIAPYWWTPCWAPRAQPRPTKARTRGRRNDGGRTGGPSPRAYGANLAHSAVRPRGRAVHRRRGASYLLVPKAENCIETMLQARRSAFYIEHGRDAVHRKTGTPPAANMAKLAPRHLNHKNFSKSDRTPKLRCRLQRAFADGIAD